MKKFLVFLGFAFLSFTSMPVFAGSSYTCKGAGRMNYKYQFNHTADAWVAFLTIMGPNNTNETHKLDGYANSMGTTFKSDNGHYYVKYKDKQGYVDLYFHDIYLATLRCQWD